MCELLFTSYYCVVMFIAITLLIDRRKTLGDLKQMLEEIVLVHSTEFKVQCIECGTIF